MKSEKKELRIIGIATAGASLLASYVLLARPWHLRWGATSEEIEESLPGDELVPHPALVSNHAITIHAPASEVWPWLVQMGQTRGGFYSYAWLENLVGCNMHNADRIVPEWQSLRAGDVVWLHPKAPPLPVIIVEPQQAIVLGGPGEDHRQQVASGTWGFYLKAVNEKTTRLIIRGRGNRNPGLLSWFGHYVLFEPAHFVMERKMMMGIKQLAENTVALAY